jgi:proprotein convertase subtilisin/kexin type 5
MWYIPCHKSCSVCLSTDKDTCITCPLFATMSGTQCICDNGYYLYKNTCVTLCPVGYTTDTVAKECLLNVLNCGTPASITTCSACNAGYFLNVLDLLCYLKCPQALETVGTNC